MLIKVNITPSEQFTDAVQEQGQMIILWSHTENKKRK